MLIKSWQFEDENFGELRSFIEDEQVTDINYDGKHVWIDHLTRGKYMSKVVLDPVFISRFCTRLSNLVSQNFNKSDNVLEAETESLRISIIHESVTNNGTTISIRKTPQVCRLTKEKILMNQYCSLEVLLFLIDCIRAHLNIVFCGLPGSGKTELLKYLTQFIPPEEKVMTIEDNLEIHYRAINPDHHCVEVKVNPDTMPYTKAIKVALRQNTEWILLSEARSKEVKYLLESLSTGLHGLTTLYTDDVRKIPDRILNMMQDQYSESKRNDIYSFIQVGVLIRKRVLPNNQIHRYIDQICVFDRDNKNTCTMIVEQTELLKYQLPINIKNKFMLYGINVKGEHEAQKETEKELVFIPD